MSLALCTGSETPSSVHTLVLTAQVLFSHLGRNCDPQSILKCFSASSSIISPDQLSFPARAIFLLTLLSGLLSPVLRPFEVSYPWHFPLVHFADLNLDVAQNIVNIISSVHLPLDSQIQVSYPSAELHVLLLDFSYPMSQPLLFL